MVILTDCDLGNSVSEVESSHRSFDRNALFIRRVGQAELAAARDMDRQLAAYALCGQVSQGPLRR